MQKINKIVAGIIFFLIILNASPFTRASENSTSSLAARLEEESIWQKIKKDVKKAWESIFSHEEDYRVKIPIPPPPPPPIGSLKNSPGSNSTFWQWYK